MILDTKAMMAPSREQSERIDNDIFEQKKSTVHGLRVIIVVMMFIR